MQKRPSVLQLNKKYHVNFFLGDLYGKKCPCIEVFPKSRKVIDRLQKEGYICVKQGDYYHIFYKE